MIQFTASILKFQNQGEKTGWTYIEIPSKIAQQLNPGVKKSFRVKGSFDSYVFDAMTLLPMGDGNFIIPLKVDVRKFIKKKAGEQLNVQLQLQPKAYEINSEFLECLNDEPKALLFFNSLPGSHRNYFSKWIESAKTEITKANRIALSINALAKKMGYAEMIREEKVKKDSV
jgi:Domain of unknown function (DUF1905)/Bacteriocin-protection, YdeI or OmpD-Associated